MRIIDRLDKYMSINDLNDNQITVSCGLSVGLLGKARQGKSDVGKKAIEKILSFYQDLNNVWLLTGEGEMLKKSEPIPPPDSISIPSSVWQVISDQAESLKAKDRQMDTMLENLRSKDTQTTEVIELLKEQLKKGLDVGSTSRAANLVADDE